MQLIRLHKNTPAMTEPLALTIGNFDGVHLGHQAMIDKLITVGKARNCRTALLTFEPSPTEYFLGVNAPARITHLTEKLSLMKMAGLDYIILLRFNAALAALSAEDFIELLYTKLNMRYLLVGDDFHFGKNRLGDVALLELWAKKHQRFQLERMPTLRLHDERVSSSRVRQSLEEGDLATASRLLGRPYSMLGRVTYGQARGRTIGFPTANILLKRHRSPLLGIYAVKVYGLFQRIIYGVANIGNRPTVDGTRSLLEVHLFDFDHDIYGKHLQVEFCQKIRDEKRFDSFELLKAQIQQDAIAVRDFFKES